MSETDAHDAWNTFWEREKRAAKPAGGGGCLPQGWAGIHNIQSRIWKDLANALPKNARVLDLATGDGMVLSQMLSARRDLKAIGIDRATALPKAPRGIELRGGVDMAKLPFPDGRFAAVTSQFGFEYGDIAKIAPEIARVLHSAGRVALMTHRADGPIVAHNRKRREQIAWAIEEQDLPQKAKNSLALRRAGLAMLPKDVIEAPEKGAALHGQASAAWEIAEAIRRTLHLGRQDAPAQVAAVLDNIAMQAENELGRIASLELAAETASDRDAVLGVMTDAGLQLVQERELVDGRYSSPFADFRVFKHRA